MSSETHDGAAVRIPPPLLFLGGALAGGLLHWTVLPLPLSLAAGWKTGITVTLAVLGILLTAAAIGLFSRTGQDPKPWKATPEIISTGIYGLTRNPMYVGMALIQAALGVGLANGWILALVPVVLAAVYWTAIRHEEAYLENKFGDAYLDYKRSVRRWI